LKNCLLVELLLIGFGAHACSAPPNVTTTGVPVEIDITQSAPEFDVGGDVAFTVTLKNEQGQPAAALADTPVILTSPALGSLNTVISKGSNSAVVHWWPEKPGVFQIRATAHDMPPRSVLVPVKSSAPTSQIEPRAQTPTSRPIEEARPARETVVPPPATAAGRGATVSGGERQVVAIVPKAKVGTASDSARSEISERIGAARAPAATPTASTPPAAPPLPPPPTPTSSPPVDAPVLKLYVEPEPVDEINRTWSADVSFMLQTASGVLKTATEDVQIDLTSRFARLSTRQVTVPAGKATSRATPIHLIADRPGEDQVEGVSMIGRASQTVRFRPAVPTAVAVTVSPNQLISDGRTAATVSVHLVDDTKHLRPAEEETEVVLASTSGTLKATSLTIPKGGRASTTTIVSTSRGPATITADAAGLDEGTAVVQFVLPAYLIVFSIVGGLLGAFVRSGNPSSGRTRKLLENLSIGAIMGLVFWAILFFGVLKAAAALPFTPSDVPAGNELGAGLLGFGGGWLGRSFFGRPRR
jgi:hypothetical protein